MTNKYTKPRSRAGRTKCGAIAADLASNGKDTSIVLYNLAEAKGKLTGADIDRGIVGSILALHPRRPLTASALVDLVCSDATAESVGARYSLSPAVVHYWSDRVGLPVRKRGARPLLQPRPEHVHILDLVRKIGISGAARRVGVSRQHVYQIVRRWAPDITSQHARPRLRALPNGTKRQARNIVVSFRLSNPERQVLLGTELNTSQKCLSASGKARLIILKYLGYPSTGGGDEAHAVSDHENSSCLTQKENVNVNDAQNLF